MPENETADQTMQGFDAGDRELPTPPFEVDPATRDRLIHVVASVAMCSTPEEIAGYLEDGFPDEVTVFLKRPGERDALSAHVDLFLTVLQAPAPQEG